MDVTSLARLERLPWPLRERYSMIPDETTTRKKRQLAWLLAEMGLGVTVMSVAVLCAVFA